MTTDILPRQHSLLETNCLLQKAATLGSCYCPPALGLVVHKAGAGKSVHLLEKWPVWTINKSTRGLHLLPCLVRNLKVRIVNKERQ